tara:strand:- start:558 stop:1019 length:462 start_codon:yes stop_codon:yes gene_type:complete
MYKNIFIVLLLIYAFFGDGILDLLDTPIPKPDPKPIIDVQSPTSEEVYNYVQAFEGLVTDPTDKAKLAIFNYEFAERVIKYDATSQDINDVYTLAGKIFFKDTLVNKYKGLSETITEMIVECIGEEDHVLTTEEKNKLHDYFMGVAWVLIQKG